MKKRGDYAAKFRIRVFFFILSVKKCIGVFFSGGWILVKVCYKKLFGLYSVFH